MCRCRAGPCYGVRGHAATRDQPFQAIQLPEASREVDGRGTEVVSLVENTQLSVGGRQALRVSELSCVDGRFGGAFALCANIQLLLLPRHLCVSRNGRCGRRIPQMGVVSNCVYTYVAALHVWLHSAQSVNTRHEFTIAKHFHTVIQLCHMAIINTKG